MQLLRDGFPDDPALDVATGRALLEGAARGRLGATLRVYRPGPTVAFGRLDRLAPGFDAAVAAARAHGFEPVLRQPGGHAAAYDGGSLCFDQVLPDPEAIPALQERFRTASELIAEALRALGVDARVGEVAGEYCPGAWTVNAGGRVKLAGTAQRVVRGASLLGAVVVVQNGARIRGVLEDVYAHLGMAFDPSTAGAAEDGVPGLDVSAVEDALVGAHAERWSLEDGAVDAATLVRARELAEDHRLTSRPGRPA
ncbi:MAG: octanoyl-[GcvH]:protein N-octanoyltransferase [Solirubrobacteraceae bacterium]|nr:octanoyl-[GcvH]:protein N-octanoyltransferase [Solirubrobacteraceae bacterium]